MKESGKSNKSPAFWLIFFQSYLLQIIPPQTPWNQPTPFCSLQMQVYTHTHTHTHTHMILGTRFYSSSSTIQQSLPCPHFQVPVQRHKHCWLPTQNPFSLLRQLQYYPGGQCVQLKRAASPTPLQLGVAMKPISCLETQLRENLPGSWGKCLPLSHRPSFLSHVPFSFVHFPFLSLFPAWTTNRRLEIEQPSWEHATAKP